MSLGLPTGFLKIWVGWWVGGWLAYLLIEIAPDKILHLGFGVGLPLFYSVVQTPFKSIVLGFGTNCPSPDRDLKSPKVKSKSSTHSLPWLWIIMAVFLSLLYLCSHRGQLPITRGGQYIVIFP